MVQIMNHSGLHRVCAIMTQASLQVKTAKCDLINSCVKGWLIITAGGHNGSDITMMKIKPPCHSSRTAVIELSNIINMLITQITPVSSLSVYLCLLMTPFHHLTTPTVEILPPRVLWLTVVINTLIKWCFLGSRCGLLEPPLFSSRLKWKVIYKTKQKCWTSPPLPCLCVSLSDFSQPVSFENAEIGQCPNLAPLPPPPPPLLPDEEDESRKEKEEGKPLDPPPLTPVPVPPAVSAKKKKK